MSTAPPVRRRPLIVFLHNPRTGGMTLRRLLKRHYPGGAMRKIPGGYYDPADLRHVAATLTPSTRIVQGHIPIGLDRLLPYPCRYVTMLRDPIERTISLYYYRLEKSHKRGQTSRLSMTMPEFLRRGNKMRDIDNGQTRRLSGCNPEFGHASPEMLELAKRNLREQVALIGLTERYDETLVLWRRALRWRHTFYVHKNAAKSRRPRDAFSAEDLQAVESYNQLDLELYDYAQRLFDQAIRRQGPGFQLELRAFTFANRQYARARRVLKRARLGLAAGRFGGVLRRFGLASAP